MKAHTLVLCWVLLLALCPLATPIEAQEAAGPLWSVGKSDNDNAEFALAPKGYAQFGEDGFFIVGQSDPKRDWPYVQPGPADGWAGDRSHTFGIAFGLKSVPKPGNCRLVLDLIDTQGQVPPRLRIDVNGRTFEHATPRGAGDASVFGDPKQGREHKVEIAFPSETLTIGNNHISITTLSGSWILYDAVALETPAGAELSKAAGTVVRSARSAPALVERDGKLLQTVQVDVLHFGPPGEAVVDVAGAAPVAVALKPGQTTVEAPVPCVVAAREITVAVRTGDKTLATRTLTLEPVRKWVVYMLPHSHVDIGYTHVQTEVEQGHWRYYQQAIEAARKTADYPPGAQFKWNVEVLWATDSYLRQAKPEERDAFLDAVRKGWIGLDALYGNELTALCRPEELVRLVEFGNRLKRQYGLTIDSAMISDVPGYTWGIVPVLAQSGVKYFSIGPNGGHRIGYTLSEWGDKPFWWRSPCGKHRVLCWIPRTGYWRGFRGAGELMSLLKNMEASGYPYDLVQLRHCLGDNAGPGIDLSEFVKDWNAKYAYPKIVIATTHEMMQEFERRYGDTLPEVRGDFTPYWEDGAGSSALETALNRAAAERLTQAETLFAILQPAKYPDEAFYQAWRNVILYDEHTWGAHCSISQPDSDFTKAQWAIKQKFALDGDVQSQELLAASTAGRRSEAAPVEAVDVFNTCSWPRTDLVVLPKGMAGENVAVKDAGGKDVHSQRLTTGELAFLARDAVPLAATRFTLHRADSGGAKPDAPAAVDGATLTAGTLAVTVDAKTGAIAKLRWGDRDLVALGEPDAPKINDYFYVAGRKPDKPERNAPPAIAAGDRGPLVASLVATGDAPGCRRLAREVRVVAGLDRVDITNVVDKEKIYKQEAVHFAFPFNVPKGVMRMDIPWAAVRIEDDLMPGACKNYFTVQRWVDVANDEFGVTWATIDAPLFEVGRITCDPTAVGWLKQLEPTQTLYSYVMNNYWETNYKAGQEGPTTFRYSIRPHRNYCPTAAERFGIERSQPLVAVAADPKSRPQSAPLQVAGNSAVLTCLKPTPDGRGLVIRLFNAADAAGAATIRWADPPPAKVELCDLTEEPIGKAPEAIELGPWQIVTLRATLAKE